MDAAAGSVAPADDLAAVVDPEGKAEAAAEGAEIDHPALHRPREGMQSAVGGFGPADDLAAVVDRLGHAEAAAEGAEIDHPALHRPRKRMISAAGDGLAEADDLAAGIDPVGLALAPDRALPLTMWSMKPENLCLVGAARMGDLQGAEQVKGGPCLVPEGDAILVPKASGTRKTRVSLLDFPRIRIGETEFGVRPRHSSSGIPMQSFAQLEVNPPSPGTAG